MSLSEDLRTLPQVMVTLLKGVAYQETDPSLWQWIVQLQPRIREYVAVLGLELILDESEGYAYLRQRARSEGDPEMPRLVPRRQLSYPVSLLLALLRKKLAEFDATSGDTRLVLGREEIVDLVRIFFADTGNEARLADRIEANINKVVELGLLRKMRGHDDQFEVRRILKAFVDAQWLNEFGARLEDYRRHAAGEGPADPEIP